MAEHATGTVGTIGTAGTVTFLFADVQDSTMLWERDPTAMRAAHSGYEEILQGAIDANGGYAHQMIGNSSQAAFPTAAQAVQAAVDAQLLLFTEQWPSSIGDFQVGMALHTGVIVEGTGGYSGPTHNRATGLLSAGHGGQVLLYTATQELVRDHLTQLRPTDLPGVQLLDLGEHRLRNLTRPERIFQLVVPGLPAHFPALRTMDSLPNNLPRLSTLLVGREKQISDVITLLRRSDVSLVTLTGPAGTGKTRLSLEIGAQMLEEQKDGVWFVELATLSPDEHKLVPSSIAETLRLREAPGQAVIETLKEYLKDKQMLLVLDNFEQVTQAASQVSSLLKAAPRLKVLVSSRIALRVYGERGYRVPPLSVPDRKRLQEHKRDSHLDRSFAGSGPAQQVGQQVTQEAARQVEQYTRYEAVRLFVERAQAVKADFVITAENAPDIASICARLDGLPLAIELAAARTRLFTPQALLGRLSDRLKILTGGARDLPARQQTMRGAIEWSYDLLSEEEKQLFRRLAIFNGGRTLEAIETVCGTWLTVDSSGLRGDDQLPTTDDGNHQPATRNSHPYIDVLEGVQSLLDKSMLVEREGRVGETRYWMLETIHDYAREKLQESGEAEPLQREHALYFMRLAEDAEPHLTGKKQQEWLDRLEDDYDNIRAALEWANEQARAGETGEVSAIGNREKGGVEAAQAVARGPEGTQLMAGEVGLRIGGAIWRFWLVRGLSTEGREQLERAISIPEASEAPLQGRLLGTLRASSTRSRIKALNGAGVLAERQGDYSSARSLTEAALDLGREVGDKHSMAFSLNNLGNVAKEQGDYPAARALYEQSLALRRELGDKGGMSASLNNLGNIVKEQRDYPAARALYEQSLVLKRELGDKGGMSASLNNLGAVAKEQGDYPAARTLYEQSLALRRELGDKWGITLSLSNLGAVAQEQGDYQAARALYEESLVLKRELGDRKGIAECLVGLGGVAVGVGQVGRGAMLLGAVEGMLQGMSAVLDREDLLPYERSVQQARALLREEEFEQAWQDGRAMSVEAAIEYALQPSAREPARIDADEFRVERYRQVEELHIEINQAKKAGQVEAITGTEYFKELQARARVMLIERKERVASNNKETGA